MKISYIPNLLILLSGQVRFEPNSKVFHYALAFTASKQGRDQVHPLAVLVSIPTLNVALTPGSPLAPFAVDGYKGVEKKMIHKSIIHKKRKVI